MIYSLNGSDWILTGWHRHQWNYGERLETGGFSIPPVAPIPAIVPGAVQSDLLSAGIIEDFNYGTRSLDMEWIENREWTYDKYFYINAENGDTRYELCFDGLDYSGYVFLNGEKVLTFEGTHLIWRIDVTDKLRYNDKNHIKVVFLLPPDVDGQVGYTCSERTLKPRFNYVWDWCPRIVNIGIHRDIYIKSYDNVKITDFYPDASINEKNGEISLNCRFKVMKSGKYHLNYKVSYHGQTEIEDTLDINMISSDNVAVSKEIKINNPNLWWANNMGEQNLYQVQIQIIDAITGKLCDETAKTIGFRHIAFEQNTGAPADSLPYTIVLNDKKIFIKGINWVPISPLYGTLRRKDYEKYLSIFKSMNINLIRVWGGALLESEDFYELCDQYGILVWQEFPQSSSGIDNAPCEESDFIEKLVKVAETYILLRRHHVCHAIWCGGNELLWHNLLPIDERSRNIEALRQIAKQLDNKKLFLPTSPSGFTFAFNENKIGQGFNRDTHGPWDYVGPEKHYSQFNSDDSLLHSETGCPASPRVLALQKYSISDIYPPRASNRLWTHRASWWLREKEYTELFKDFADDGSEMDLLVTASRYIQFEALRYAAEAVRRGFPHKAGIIIWMGNESFPNFANTSLIEYDGTAKPAYYSVKKAFSPVHVSAKYEKINYKSGEEFTCGIYALSECKSGNIEVRASITDIYGSVLAGKVFKAELNEPVVSIGDFSLILPEIEHKSFFLHLELHSDGQILSQNSYAYTVDSERPFGAFFALPKCECKLYTDPYGCSITNTSNVIGLNIFIHGDDEYSQPVLFDKNTLTLMPGETKKLSILSGNSPVKLHTEGMNV